MNIGSILKSGRLEKKETISEIASAIRVNKKYLQALEENNFLLIPSQVYAKGFLKAYSEYLGIDPKPLIQELLGYFKTNEESKKANIPLLRKQKLISGNQLLLIAGSAALFVVICISLYFGYKLTSNIKIAAKPAVTVQPVPVVSKIIPKVTIKIEAVERSWVLVSVENKQVYSETMEPGASVSFTGKFIGVKAGNGGGIRIIRDGKTYGPMGAKDQVVEQTYKASQ